MTLSLTASPQIVAREAKPGVWHWLIEDVGSLRMAVAEGLAGMAHRRDNGGQFVLMAWSVPAQQEAAKPLQAAREQRRLRQVLLAPAGYTPRVYRKPRSPQAMRTHGGFEPAHW